MIRPQRILQQRKARASIQRTSRSLNGLPAKSVARPSKFGNPFNWKTGSDDAGPPEYRRGAAVDLFREWLHNSQEPEAVAYRKAALEELPGHNLACYCPANHPCHADALLAWLQLHEGE